ncbi:inositol 2-dehydrogenase [Cypionkella sp.]|jgi:myo-inositol 2-dehydrogenase/D-chiro-inositol 1-dehydrogenase|uniref:inositol 2-dehydrogenase n=1 Tax=Cypionkella sp. TaxID=2811411 RepID=UPI002716C59D|nr:inositol 2-dehydrogenase [Cypionkella sp.]MDO8984485.1 inositol 2-dehydrogenase [Cypionkella sp.]MDP2049690.1 inositol 2-dehydrogenase [Cypionkella sp.]
MLRIAVLGCGRIGQMHAANVARHPRAELAMVYDVHAPSADKVAQTLGVTAAQSAEAVFSDPTVDAVLIATATPTHADYIEMAIATGKAVLCEKPIDLNLARVNACAAKIGNTSIPIQLGFNRRYDPGHSAARNAMLAGDIGDLHQVIITSRDPAIPPRAYLEAAGGLFRDMTIHDFDLARFMLGEEPTEVFAIGGALIDPVLGAELNEVDSAMFILRTASGKQCHINNSRTAVYGYDQRVELMGSDGMIISDNRKPHEMRRYGAKSVEASEPYQFFFLERYNEAFMAEIDGFVDCVEKGAAPLASFEDGRRALILAEAAYLSMKERRLVQVSEVKA